MNNKISIIIPVYNAEKYLEKTIDSIINQKYENYDVILINDGSKDNSPTICDKYAANDKRIKVYHIENQGVSHARNLGIEKAKNDYIIFVDSDDLLENNALYNINKIINQHKDFDLIQTDHIEFNEEIPKKIEYNESYEELLEKDINKAVETLMAGITRKDNKIIPGPWCKIYKKENLMKWNIRFNENFYIYEDGIFNLEYLLNCNKVYTYKTITYLYRVANGGSLTHSFKSNYLMQRYNMINYMKTIIDKSNYDKKIYNIFCIQSLISIYYFYLFNKKRPNDYLSSRKEFKEIVNKGCFKESLKYKYIKEMTIKKQIIAILSKMRQYTLIKLIYKLM